LILADTSVWIDHLRSGSKDLRRHLDQGQIVIHPFIIAELALGSLKDRTMTLTLLDLLPRVRVARMNELRLMIEARRLYNVGIGLTDAHLIASVFRCAHASVDERSATPQSRRKFRHSRRFALRISTGISQISPIRQQLELGLIREIRGDVFNILPRLLAPCL